MSEQKQVIIPDSSEARALAGLGSLSADLGEARRTVELAVDYEEAENDRERAVYRQLISHAVVVYGRVQTKSGARKALWSFISVPANLQATHDQAMLLRNRTIAHSESDLETSHAIAVLTNESGVVDIVRVFVVVSSAPPPHPFVHQLLALIKELQRLLKPELDRARLAVVASLDAQQRNELWRDGMQPQLKPGLESDWEPGVKRPPYPTSHEIPIHLFGD